jgi:colanic acid/amylovoran biosynthesis glycosyltransferase
MKNVLVFSHKSFPLSATFIYRQTKAAAMQNKVFLVTMESSNEEKFPLENVTRWLIKTYYGKLDRLLFFIKKKAGGTPLKFSDGALEKFKKFIRENNIDVIHIHYGTWAVHLLPLLRNLEIPFFVSFHGYDASMAIHNKNFYQKSLPEVFDRAARIVIVSDHMHRILNLERWDKKVALVPYGVDPSVFKTDRKVSSDEKIRILHSGRLTAKKGVPDLIRVFAKLRQVHDNISLTVLGDGIELKLCEEIARELNVNSSVSFLGAKPMDEVIKAMRDCDIFVLNSRTAEDGDMEGLPNALLEAMSMEMAVVSTHHAGIPMVVDHGLNGLLVSERDNEGLHTALSSLFTDSAIRRRLGTEARKKILEGFTLDHMNKKLQDLYNDISK